MTSRSLVPLLLILLAAGCAAPQEGSAPERDPDFADVHGLAIDPLDPSFVLVATHRGLWRGNDEGWSRVGRTQDDLMGFALAPDGRTAYSSGHPPAGGALGVRRSTDGGATWAPIGAAGADFHALAVSPVDPNRLYGQWRFEVFTSDDAGASWTKHGALQALALAADPKERDVVYAATGRALVSSSDAGRSWTTEAQVPATSVAFGRRLLVLGPAAVASVEGDALEAHKLPNANETFVHLAARDDIIVVASLQTGVYRSDDGGFHWRALHAPRSS